MQVICKNIWKVELKKSNVKILEKAFKSPTFQTYYTKIVDTLQKS